MGEGVLDDVTCERCAEERLDRRERSCGVVRLVRAVQRQQQLVVGRERREEIHEPPAHCEVVGAHAEVDVAPQDLGRTAVGEEVLELRIGLAQHERGPRLHDACLLGCDPFACGPEQLDMVDRDVRHHRNACRQAVRRVPGTAQTDLDDRDVDGEIGEPAVRARGEDVEPRRVDPELAFDDRDRAQQPVELLVGDRFALVHDPLVDALEVRARERPDRQPDMEQELRGDARGARLAVGSRDVHGRELELGRSEVLEQRVDTLATRRGRTSARGHPDTGLEVDVTFEPLAWIHRGAV